MKRCWALLLSLCCYLRLAGAEVSATAVGLAPSIHYPHPPPPPAAFSPPSLQGTLHPCSPGAWHRALGDLRGPRPEVRAVPGARRRGQRGPAFPGRPQVPPPFSAGKGVCGPFPAEWGGWGGAGVQRAPLSPLGSQLGIRGTRPAGGASCLPHTGWPPRQPPTAVCVPPRLRSAVRSSPCLGPGGRKVGERRVSGSRGGGSGAPEESGPGAAGARGPAGPAPSPRAQGAPRPPGKPGCGGRGV